MLLVIFEFLLALVVVFIGVTQVLLPLLNGTKYFPMFRNNELASKVHDLQDEVGNLKELNALNSIKSKLETERDSLSKKD